METNLFGGGILDANIFFGSFALLGNRPWRRDFGWIGLALSEQQAGAYMKYVTASSAKPKSRRDALRGVTTSYEGGLKRG